jgi:cytidine deaminase
MKTKEIRISISEFENLHELPVSDQELVLKARAAAPNAYAPYSKYLVGTALRLSNGTIVAGNNQENASSPLGICAERTALFWANANYPGQAVESIAVSAINQHGKAARNVSPCGACRQVMLETQHRFKHPMRVILDSGDKIEILNNVEGLLPLSFNGDSLNPVV